MTRFRKIPRTKLYINAFSILKALLKLPFDRLNRTEYSHETDQISARVLGFKYGITVSTCRMAIQLALKSFDLKSGDEVLLAPITIPDTVNAIHTLGLRPVFVDIDPTTHFIDEAELQNKISDKSKVLLLTYLSGFVPDMALVLEVAAKYNLRIIEDISQNYNTSFDNKVLGSFGDAAVGTLSIGKALASLGGGVYLTNNEDNFHKVLELYESTFTRPSRSFILSQILHNLIFLSASNSFIFSCITFPLIRFLTLFNPDILDNIPQLFRSNSIDAPLYDNPCVLRNEMPAESFYWFSDLQSVILRSSLMHLETSDKERVRAAEQFFIGLDNDKSRNIPRILKGGRRNVFWHLPYMTDNKTGLQLHLLKHGIDSIGFKLRNCANEKAFDLYKRSCPNAEKVIKQTVLLPIHSSFSSEDMKRLSAAINNYKEA